MRLFTEDLVYIFPTMQADFCNKPRTITLCIYIMIDTIT